MLENGYASVIAIPPNVWNLECYRQAERRAQTQHKGLWSETYHHIAESVTLDKDTHGFHIVKGRVNHVGETDKSLWLDLDGGIALRIDRGDLPYFAGIKIMELKNHVIIVRGWVHQDDDRPVMRLRHAVSLQVLD